MEISAPASAALSYIFVPEIYKSPLLEMPPPCLSAEFPLTTLDIIFSFAVFIAFIIAPPYVIACPFFKTLFSI
ncbi:hypothetical protein D3C74_392200 [compost metagenome]